MKGYWKNEEATKEIFVDGPDGRWMRTGDVAYVDDRGRFFIVDRMKELIKVKGNQVAPAELEALLLEHPQIADSAVVGVTIKSEEVPRAYVVVQDGQKADEKEVEQWLAKRVSRHKRLVGGVVFVDAVPKNPVSEQVLVMVLESGANLLQSGKILRKQLRERAEDEVGDKKAKL
jgi:acyl-CoA synthetase (AMP-forming)/AMP-acid ligase II